MKVRCGFVSNSSSSSFVISKRRLTMYQQTMIRNHSAEAKRLGLPYAECAWDIQEDDDEIRGFTIVDNFDMLEFLDMIGVEDKDVEYEHS